MIPKWLTRSIPLFAVVFMLAAHAHAAVIYATTPASFSDTAGQPDNRAAVRVNDYDTFNGTNIHQIRVRIKTNTNTAITIQGCIYNYALGDFNCQTLSSSQTVVPDGGSGSGSIQTFTFDNGDFNVCATTTSGASCTDATTWGYFDRRIYINGNNSQITFVGDSSSVAGLAAYYQYNTATTLAIQVALADAGGFGDNCADNTTQICNFTPGNGDTVEGPDVDFTLHAYVNAADIGPLTNIVVKLHNIDQNVLLAGFLSPSDIVLLNEPINTGGDFFFSTSTPIGDGNYRLEASLTRKFFFDWITVPFGDINQIQNHQFVVGEPTYIGNLTQNGFDILTGATSGRSATSSLALVARCNPLGDYDMVDCLSGLFVPDAGQINNTLQGARDGILTRMPWGYITRFVNIVSNPATSSLPTWEVEVAMNDASDTTTFSFDPGDMLAGAGSLLDETQDPYSHLNIRQILEPLVQLGIGIAVLLTIVSDITGSHRHGGEAPADEVRRKRK